MTLDFSTPEYAEVIKLAKDYISLKGNASPAGWERLKPYIISLKCIFVQTLLEWKSNLTAQIALKIETDYDFLQVMNPDLKMMWY